MKKCLEPPSEALVSGTSSVSQKLAGSALVPQEEGGEEKKERECADEEADEGQELHAEGQARTQRHRRFGERALVGPILGNETSRQLLELLKRAEGVTAGNSERIRYRLMMKSNYGDEDEFYKL